MIGADGANSRVAKEMDAGEYDYAIAFQERIRIPEEKMDYYKDLAEMCVGRVWVCWLGGTLWFGLGSVGWQEPAMGLEVFF